MMYRTFYTARTVEYVDPFIEGDDRIEVCSVKRREGRVIEADDRPTAIEAGRALYGRDFTGVEAIGVKCTFCEDRPVGNAARWTDANAPATAACPRCGEHHG